MSLSYHLEIHLKTNRAIVTHTKIKPIMETASGNVTPLPPGLFLKFIKIIKRRLNRADILYSVPGYSLGLKEIVYDRQRIL